MTTTITIRGLDASFGDTPVLRGVDLNLVSGGLIGLIGPNGAGKSTLLRLLARLHEPAGGCIALNGLDITTLSRRDLARQVAYLQQGHTMYWPLRADHVVALGRLPHLGRFASPSAQDARAIRTAMKRADVAMFADRTVDTLSGGERSRVMLARALATESTVLLADEPVASLDPYHQLQAMELLRELAQDGVLVIAVLHDLPLAARFCDRVVLLHDGTVIAEGRTSDVLVPEHLGKAYGVESIYGRENNERFVLPWRRLNAEGRHHA
ncbi:MAG TPA: ABC transporter ATP-binding protein [Rhizomicrobium sp.]|nr:ABC transporter ATP-binding protein [Rhizomicrobium sp.]